MGDSLRINDLIAEALDHPVATEDGRLQLSFVRALGQSGSADVVLELFRRVGVIEKLAEEVWRGAVALNNAPAATSSELYSKFDQDPHSFKLAFGGLAAYYGGLDALIGNP